MAFAQNVRKNFMAIRNGIKKQKIKRDRGNAVNFLTY